MKLLRKLLILSHRYLGIAISLLVMMWFATGIVMMYAGGMPRLTPELRLERLAALEVSRVELTPSEAARTRGPSLPARPRVAADGDGPAGVSLAGGDRSRCLPTMAMCSTRSARPRRRTIASRFLNLPEDRVQHVETLIETDQWTLGQGRQLPVHKFRVDDGDGTELYVSSADRRRDAVDNPPQPDAGMDRHDSPLALFRGAARQPAALVSHRGVDVDARLHPRRSWPCPGGHAVQANETVPAGGGHPVLRLDAMALHHRRRLRHLHAHVGLQRPALDGAVRVDECHGTRGGARCLHRRARRSRPVRPRWTPAAWERLLGGRRSKKWSSPAFRMRRTMSFVTRRQPGWRRQTTGAAAPAVRRHRPERTRSPAGGRGHARGPQGAVQRRLADGQAQRRAARCARHRSCNCSRSTTRTTTREDDRRRCPFCACGSTIRCRHGSTSTPR